MSRPRKHKYRELEVGEEVVAHVPRWLKSAIYNYGAQTGRKYSITKVEPGKKDSAYVIRRTA